MKIKYYFSKEFATSDNHEIETLRTHYYRARKEQAMEVVCDILKNDKAKVRSIDEERGEIIFDHMDYSGTATVTATSFSEMAIDFNVLTYNVLPTAKGKKVIENIYKLIDKKLDLKGLSLYK